MKPRWAICILMMLNLAACEQSAVMVTPEKHPIQSDSKLSIKAESFFWNTLHQGRYQDIEKSDYLLMAAYLKNPNDPKLAAHMGFLHIWKITERQRTKTISPLITNEISLSKKYFADALALDPHNPVYQGFYGDTLLIEGKIFNDKRESVRGYFVLKKAIAHLPQFNYFTAGYPMSDLAADTPQFKEALKWQWSTLDLCAGKKIDHHNPDYSAFMNQEKHQGKARACWNSWIAPHSFEGFFMNMGDMLVKTGDWQTGVKIYRNAKLSKTYASWPYRSMLENRIINAKQNVKNFQSNHASPHKSILFNSGYGCVACHQS